MVNDNSPNQSGLEEGNVMPSTNEAVQESVSKSLRAVWWIPLLRGVLLLALGVLVMIEPLNTLKTLATIIGIFLLADGVVALINGWALRRQTGWRVWLVQGLIDLVFALLILFWPGLTIVVFFYLIVIWTIALGSVAIIGAALLAKTKNLTWPWLLAFGLLSTLFGIVLLLRNGGELGRQAEIIGLVIGIYAFMLGALQIVSAFSVRSAAKDIDNALHGQSEVLVAFNDSQVRYEQAKAEARAERIAQKELAIAEKHALKEAEKAREQAQPTEYVQPTENAKPTVLLEPQTEASDSEVGQVGEVGQAFPTTPHDALSEPRATEAEADPLTGEAPQGEPKS